MKSLFWISRAFYGTIFVVRNPCLMNYIIFLVAPIGIVVLLYLYIVLYLLHFDVSKKLKNCLFKCRERKNIIRNILGLSKKSRRVWNKWSKDGLFFVENTQLLQVLWTSLWTLFLCIIIMSSPLQWSNVNLNPVFKKRR